MDKNGKWKVKIRLWRTDTAAQLDWTLYDPNGYEAGKGDASSQGKDEVGFYVESKNRILEHHMPFGVNGWLRDWPKFDDARVQFLIEKTMPNCDYLWKAPCKPSMQTENRLETMMFEVNTCWQYCKNEKDQLVLPSDMNCQDLNDADWYDALDGAKHRAFECFWKGF
jgi:chitinase